MGSVWLQQPGSYGEKVLRERNPVQIVNNQDRLRNTPMAIQKPLKTISCIEL